MSCERGCHTGDDNSFLFSTSQQRTSLLPDSEPLAVGGFAVS